MTNIRNCPDCGSSAFESDGTTACGTVLEQNAIVSEITFGEASTGAAIVQGSYVAQGQTHTRAFGPYRQNWASESREQTLALGRRRIASVVFSLNMPERFVDSALRLYTQAVNINFIQGRRSRNVVASCLYIVCRFEKTSHMLIDFSDKLGVNVFTLGATFLKLVSALSIKLPLVDPSLYLPRFAALLEFGSETQNVAADATRLIQRMNRDWMVYGRRPSGLCGAALLIAARMNNFRRSMTEIVQVVKIGDTTLKKRIEEFKLLPSAALSVQDFRSIVLEQNTDPPAFKKTYKEPALLDIKRVEKEISDTLHSENFKLAWKSFNNSNPEPSNDQVNLSDVDDDEIESMLLNEEAVQIKTDVWMRFNKDYLDAQEEKRLKKEQDISNGVFREPKQRKRKSRRLPLKHEKALLGGDVIKDVLQQKQYSKKINYDALNDILND